MHTWIKNPPDNMEAITITEDNVAAFFTSMNAAPIVRPRPCNLKKTRTCHITLYKIGISHDLILDFGQCQNFTFKL